MLTCLQGSYAGEAVTSINAQCRFVSLHQQFHLHPLTDYIPSPFSIGGNDNADRAGGRIYLPHSEAVFPLDD